MITDELYSDYFEHLLQGNRKYCTTVVKSLLEKGIEVNILYDNLFKASLYEIGKLWEENKVSVAIEHLATSITSNLMSLTYPYLFTNEKNGKKAIVSCVANEYHQIGGQMVADILEMNGWDAYFLGANTPENEMLKMIDDVKPNLLALSLAMYMNVPNLVEIIDKVRANYDLPIIVGGQAFRWGGKEAIAGVKQVQILNSLDQLSEVVI